MESHILNSYHEAGYSIHERGLRSVGESFSSKSPDYSTSDEEEEMNIQNQKRNNSYESENEQDPETAVEEYVIQNAAHGFPENFYSPNVIFNNVDDEQSNADEAEIHIFAVDPELDLEYSSDDDFTSEDRNINNRISEVHRQNRVDISTMLPNQPLYNSTPIKNEIIINKNADYTKIDIDEPNLHILDHKPILEEPINKAFSPIKRVKPDTKRNLKKEGLDDCIKANCDIKRELSGISLKMKVSNKCLKNNCLPVSPVKKLLDNTKSKSSQKKSFSLPHSPLHFLYPDDDARTSLSFEDINDFIDFNLDVDIRASSKTFDLSSDLVVDDQPRTLTDEDIKSFLITDKPPTEAINENKDDLHPQDMDIECPLPSSIDCTTIETDSFIKDPKISVLDFCLEKNRKTIKVDLIEIKNESEDFVDVESINDTSVPVLEANNLNSLLEQFEATEKLNSSNLATAKCNKSIQNKCRLSNGIRIQDAAAQINKNKIQHILMSTSTPKCIVTEKTRQTSNLDHDYCSPSKRHSVSVTSKVKHGQSLLKPEVLSSNSKIRNSRHRACKTKKAVDGFNSDKETCTHPKNIEIKPNKTTLHSNHRKKALTINVTPKKNTTKSVKKRDVGKLTNGSIKLTIKNKSEVILKLDCDDKKDLDLAITTENGNKGDILERKLDIDSNMVVEHEKIDMQNNSNENTVLYMKNSNKGNLYESERVCIKQELFEIEHDYTCNTILKDSINTANDSIKLEHDDHKIIENPPKKKLNLQEYKLRREGVSSNANSRAITPEAIFPIEEVEVYPVIQTTQVTQEITAKTKVIADTIESENNSTRKIFDPIREASRKILLNTKKQRAEALRKKDEELVKSKIPKVENLTLQPLICDSEMLKIEKECFPELFPPEPTKVSGYDEIIMFSVGVNTDAAIFDFLNTDVESNCHNRSLINFKIKKSPNLLKQNVFDRSDVNLPKVEMQTISEQSTSPNMKIDKERLRDITATLKSVEENIEIKISSNSLLASIQNVMKKKEVGKTEAEKLEKKFITVLVKDYDIHNDHGEEKVILHLEKNRQKPTCTDMITQTDCKINNEEKPHLDDTVKLDNRKRNNSDMSISSDCGINDHKNTELKSDSPKSGKIANEGKSETRSRSKENYYRCRKTSRSRKSRHRSHHRSRNRSRHRSHYSNRRSSSHHRRKKRSLSPYRHRKSSRSKHSRSRSRRRNYKSDHRSVARQNDTHDTIKSNGANKNLGTDKRCELKTFKDSGNVISPIRKSTTSESSDISRSSKSRSGSYSSSVSSLTSSSVDSQKSPKRRRPDTPSQDSCRLDLKIHNAFGINESYKPYSSDDRECNTPVEERRIVFVGKLEKHATKQTLRKIFSQFGHIMEVTLHSKEDNSRYGFVTFRNARDAWTAVETSKRSLSHYDIGFGGRRAFCRQRYADLDGIEAEYTESSFHGPPSISDVRNDEDMSFEQMLFDVKKKLIQLKNEKRRNADSKA